MIICGGLNLPEGESRFGELEGVKETAVIGVPHADFGEAVVAVIADRGRGTDQAGVIEFSRVAYGQLQNFKRVFLVGELPRNAMGKVQKNLLRERATGLLRARADAHAD